MIRELLPFVAIGNDVKQRIVDGAETVRPLVPVHHVSVEPGLDCLPNLPGALVALSIQNLKLFPVDNAIIYGHVICDRALVQISLRNFSFRTREGLIGYRVNFFFFFFLCSPSLVLNFPPVCPI